MTVRLLAAQAEMEALKTALASRRRKRLIPVEEPLFLESDNTLINSSIVHKSDRHRGPRPPEPPQHRSSNWPTHSNESP